MALRVTQTDPEAIGERWEDFDSDVSIKLAGLDDERYQIALERARRLIDRADAGQSLADLSAKAGDAQEIDVQCMIVGKYIIRDWKGAVLGEDGEPIGYSPEAAQKLLRTNMDLFVWVIAQAAKIASERKKEVAETMGKSLSASNGSASGRGKGKSSD